MGETTPEQEFPLETEASIIRNHLLKLQELSGGKEPKIEGMTGTDEGRHLSRAWRIVLNQNKEKISSAAIFDWDDTLEAYTDRKRNFHLGLLDLIGPKDSFVKENFLKSCKFLNKVARVLPNSGVHPERYAPLFELMAENTLVDSLSAGGLPNFMAEIATVSEDDEAENLARNFLQEQILPKFGGKVETIEETNGNGERKTYFRETESKSVAASFDQKPIWVSQQVWDLFKDMMTRANIPDAEFGHFDLPKDVRFLVASFGEIDFQLEKIVNGLEAVKEKGGRIPDEILVYTRGRKNPILKKIVDSFLNIQFIYVDDSPRQIERVAEIANLVPILAKRKGSKRSGEVVEGVREVDIENTKMSEIIKLAKIDS